MCCFVLDRLLVKQSIATPVKRFEALDNSSSLAFVAEMAAASTDINKAQDLFIRKECFRVAGSNASLICASLQEFWAIQHSTSFMLQSEDAC